MKRVLLLLIAISMLACSACAETNEYPAPMRISTDMPADKPAEGESIGYFKARLYFVSQDGRTLSYEERDIEFDADASIVELAIRALIDGPANRLLLKSIPAGLELSHIELSNDVCNVYFTGVFPAEMRSWIIARTAIATTVAEVSSVDAVNVYFGDMEPGYLGRALGAQTSIAFSLDAFLTSTYQEYEVLPQGATPESATSVMRELTLYYLENESGLLMPQNKQITYSVIADKATLVQMVIDNLIKAPQNEAGLVSPIPKDIQLVDVPKIEYTGELPVLSDAAVENELSEAEPKDRDMPCIVDVVLSEPESEFDTENMCGAITLSLTGFLPKVEGVRISFARTNIVTGEQIITPLNDGKPFVRFDFSERIGCGIYINCPRPSGVTLLHVKRIVKGSEAYSMRKRLELLLDYLTYEDSALTSSDILDVYMVNDLAVINWAKGFTDYAKAYIDSGEDGYEADRETAFVFSIVNTMCELSQIQRVWMLEDGKKLGMLGNVYLGNSLFKHSGIVTGD